MYWSIFPRFLVNCATWCVLEHILPELSLKKIYINLNNIDNIGSFHKSHSFQFKYEIPIFFAFHRTFTKDTISIQINSLGIHNYGLSHAATVHLLHISPVNSGLLYIVSSFTLILLLKF